MSDVTMRDAVKSAMEGNPSDFKNSVNSLLMDKIRQTVEIEKHKIAADFMNDTQEVETDEEI